MSASKAKLPKRQAMREKRRQQQRKQRLILILVVVGVALLITALLILPNLRPVGEITQVTPKERPQQAGNAMGDPNAPVKIEVYEDFQCPACKTYSETIAPQVVENLVASGKVYYTFRHFPFLDDNAASRESDQAANASMCAAEQNRFWDYHDILFANWNGENQGSYRNQRLVAFAQALNLDMDAFNPCFEQNRFRDEIQADQQSGERLGVTGTPTILVNGEIISPGRVPTYEMIEAAVIAAIP
ncbi:MAG TPA: thioredoxin domain-containing protein [Anaerolineales bacterium]|nr:thioredoxin domain-containing protein [Anaerolineales bacterium]